MSDLAEKVRELETSTVETAMGRLLELWRSRRAPELAELILELSAQQEYEALAGKTNAQRSKHFLEITASNEQNELPRLLKVFPIGKIAPGTAQMEALSALPNDPRTADALLAMFSDPPYRSRAALSFWQGAIKLIARIGDSRSRAKVSQVLENIDTRFAAPMNRLLRSELEPVRDALPLAPDPDADLRSATDHLRAKLLKASAPNIQGADALLAEIYLVPGEDQLRLVYADACIAANDPRGEAIVIDSVRAQGARPTPSQTKREKKILATETGKWLGPLERVLLKSSIKFRLGFLDSATIKPKHDTDVRPIIGDPRWSTVRALEIKAVSDYHNENAAGAAASVEELVCDPIMRSLRHLTGDLSPALVEELCNGSKERPLETMAVVIWRDQVPELLPIIANATKLPALRELISRQPHRSSPADHQWLFDGSLFQQLNRLELRIQLSALPEWFNFFAASSIERLAICDSWAHTRIEFVREAGGLGVEAKFRYPADIRELVRLLNTLPPGALERIEVQWSRASNAPSEKMKVAVKAAVERLAPKHSKLSK